MNLSRHPHTGETVTASVAASGLIQVQASGSVSSSSIFMTRVDAMRMAALAAGVPAEALDENSIGRGLVTDNTQIVAIAQQVIEILEASSGAA